MSEAALWPDLLLSLQPWVGEVRGQLIPNQMLSEMTTLRVGGPAQLLFRPADEDDLAPALGAAVAHADAYGGLEVLAVWLEARRMLLFERFLDRWKGL